MWLWTRAASWAQEASSRLLRTGCLAAAPACAVEGPMRLPSGRGRGRGHGCGKRCSLYHVISPTWLGCPVGARETVDALPGQSLFQSRNPVSLFAGDESAGLTERTADNWRRKGLSLTPNGSEHLIRVRGSDNAQRNAQSLTCRQPCLAFWSHLKSKRPGRDWTVH